MSGWTVVRVIDLVMTPPEPVRTSVVQGVLPRTALVSD